MFSELVSDLVSRCYLFELYLPAAIEKAGVFSVSVCQCASVNKLKSGSGDMSYGVDHHKWLQVF